MPRTADAKPFTKPLWYWVLLVVLVAVIALTAVPAFTVTGGHKLQQPGAEDFFPGAIFGEGTLLEFNRLTLVRVVMGVALCLTVGVVASRIKIVPGRGQALLEIVADFVRSNVAFTLLGNKNGRRFAPLLGTLFLGVLAMNLAGVIPGLNNAQARSQMSLWCMLASPLALTCDLRAIPQGEANGGVSLPTPLVTKVDLATLTNADIIAINQDALGQQAEYMAELSTGITDFAKTGFDVYVKDLTGGRKAIAVTNRSGASIASRTLDLTKLYLKATATYLSKNVWTGTTTEVTGRLTTGALAPYETKVFLLTEKSGTTGIAPLPDRDQTAAAQAQGRLHDLSGRRVSAPTSGVYVLENGAKIIR